MLPPSQVSDVCETKELLSIAHRVVAATNFFYKNFNSLKGGQLRDVSDTDGTRGDLALQSLERAISQGVHVVAADGGSSADFLSALNRFETSGLLTLVNSTKPGRGPQRKAAFEVAGKLLNKQAIVYFQPEKVSLMNHLAEITHPILDGDADIVVPARTSELFEQTFPGYMRDSELNVNRTYNWLMQCAKLLPKNEKLDWFFGPVVFKNDPEIVSYFLKEYRLKSPIRSRVGAQPDPELHSNSHYFPIIEALFRKKRVVSVEIPFVYPQTQKDNETSPEKIEGFKKRRKLDASAYRLEALHFLAYLQGKPESKIQPEYNAD